MEIHEYYANLADRNAAAKEYKALGKRFRLRTATNLSFFPDRVIGYKGTISPNGFGGAAAQFFAKLYILTILG